MFNFFKGKAAKLERHVALIKAVCRLLPIQFNYLGEQVNDGIINGVRLLEKPFPNYKKFILDTSLIKRYEDEKGRSFFVKGILVYDLKSQTFVEIYLVIGFGILMGYSTSTVSDFDPDFNQINTASVYTQYFGENEFNKLRGLFTPDEIKLINPANFYLVELHSKNYYHIKDLENGDFIGIDMEKNLYKITHDPFEVNKLDVDLLHIL